MNRIEWRSEFSTGLAEVDHEHRGLIDLINEALDRCADAPSDRGAIQTVLGEIYARTTAHFALEERLMEQLEYDQRREHKDDHERLLDDIRDIMDGVGQDAGFDAERFAARLGSWFGEHFRTHDARFHLRVGMAY
jgi:hemerythrin-like metal-binding protein